jgi:hypothetical protein
MLTRRSRLRNKNFDPAIEQNPATDLYLNLLSAGVALFLTLQADSHRIAVRAKLSANTGVMCSLKFSIDSPHRAPYVCFCLVKAGAIEIRPPWKNAARLPGPSIFYLEMANLQIRSRR